MPRRRLTTQGLTEGAILASLVAAFALATRYVPVLGMATAFLVPLPLTVLVIRRGLWPALLAAAVAGTIAGMVAGPLAGIGILLTFAPFGIVVGLGARAGRSAPAILGMAALATAVSLTIDLALTLALSGVNPYQTMIESMRQGQEASMTFYRRLGVNPPGLEETNRQMMQVLAIMPKLIPMLLALGGLSVAWLNYQVARPVLRRLGYLLPALPPASTWRVPAYVLWLLPLAFVLLSLTGRPVMTLSDRLRSTLPAARVAIPGAIGLNVTLLIQFVFAFQGLLVAWVLLGRYIRVPAMRVLILAFAFLNPLLGYLIMLMGMAESVFRLRERFAAPRAAAEAES